MTQICPSPIFAFSLFSGVLVEVNGLNYSDDCLVSNGCLYIPECIQVGKCCPDYVQNNWTQIVTQEAPRYICRSAVIFHESYSADLVQEETIAIVGACDGTENWRQDLRDKCANNKDYLDPDSFQLHLDPEVSIGLFLNRFCAECNSALNRTKPLVDARYCNASVKMALMGANLTVLEKAELYFTRCSYILTKSVLRTSGFLMSEYITIDTCDISDDGPVTERPSISANSSQQEKMRFFCYAGYKNFCYPYKNVFCASLDNYTACDMCGNGYAPIDNSGVEDIPSFSMMIDFRRPNQLVSSRDTFRQMVDKCGSVNITQDGDLEYCSVTTCSNESVYVSLLKRCINPLNTLYLRVTAVPYYMDIFSYSYDPTCTPVCMHFLPTSLRPICSKIATLGKNGEFSMNGELLQVQQTDTFIFVKEFENRDSFLEAFEHIVQLISVNSLTDYEVNVTLQNETIFEKGEKLFEYLNDTFIVQHKVYSATNIFNWNNRTVKVVRVRNNCTTEVYQMISEANETEISALFSGQGTTEELTVRDSLVLYTRCGDLSATVTPTKSLSSQINSRINQIFIPVSIVTLGVTMITYAMFKELRTLPGICTLQLCVCLFSHYLLFFVLSLLGARRIGETACWIGAVLNHLAALCVFTWSLCLSYTSKQAFSTGCGFSSTSNSKIVKLSLAAYLPPFMLVCVFLGLSLCREACLADAIGYINGNLCWLRPGYSTLFGMTIPAVILVTLTMILYVWTVVSFCRTIKETSMVSSKGAQSKLFILVILKLGVLLGIVWLLPALNIWLRSEVFDVFSNFLIASQGLLISCAFTCNARVFRLYNKKRLGLSTSAFATKTSSFMTRN